MPIRVMAKINNWSPNTWDGNAGARYQVCLMCLLSCGPSPEFFYVIQSFSQLFTKGYPYLSTSVLSLSTSLGVLRAEHTNNIRVYTHITLIGWIFRSSLGPSAFVFYRNPDCLHLVREEAALSHL